MMWPRQTSHGPFRADQIRPGDPYELSKGHAIHCMTTGARGSRAHLVGSAVLDTDPDVEEAGIDTGFSPDGGTLRAPDVAVGNVPDEPGWVKGAPPLAVEYADTGQDEKDLQVKISELLAAGTRMIWVVRLTGPRRVEVYEPDREMRRVLEGEELEAPGILRNPVPVEALYDREAAHRATFRNLLQRQGYRDLDEVRDVGREAGRQEGREEGREEGCAALRRALLDIVESRGLEIDTEARERIAGCGELSTLQRWMVRSASAETAERIFAEAPSP